MKLGLPLLLTVLALAAPSPAADVDMDAPDGIAAIVMTDHLHVLGTDGDVYILMAAGVWKRELVDWPIPVTEIVAWVPGDQEAGLGFIQSRSGEWWYHRARRDYKGDRVRDWARLTLDEIHVALKEGDRRR